MKAEPTEYTMVTYPETLQETIWMGDTSILNYKLNF